MVDPTPCFGDHQYARSDDTAGMAEFVDQGLQTELTMEDIAKLEDQATKMRVLFEEAITANDRSMNFFTGLPSKNTAQG